MRGFFCFSSNRLALPTLQQFHGIVHNQHAARLPEPACSAKPFCRMAVISNTGMRLSGIPSP
ncbi:hypothetical protein CNY67_11715 [Desulfovibrio sp. G11]|nr:hypothetical protein CNY67_11715 [Desulfovibrio sp. G11]